MSENICKDEWMQAYLYWNGRSRKKMFYLERERERIYFWRHFTKYNISHPGAKPNPTDFLWKVYCQQTLNRPISALHSCFSLVKKTHTFLNTHTQKKNNTASNWVLRLWESALGHFIVLRSASAVLCWASSISKRSYQEAESRGKVWQEEKDEGSSI